MYDEKPVISMVEVFLRDHLSIENVCFVLLLRDLFSMSDELKLGKLLFGLESHDRRNCTDANYIATACEDFISYRFKKVSKTSAFKKLSSEVQSLLEVIFVLFQMIPELTVASARKKKVRGYLCLPPIHKHC
jgi:hypothetical protein